jgi:arylsulfatase A-like enzyme
LARNFALRRRLRAFGRSAAAAGLVLCGAIGCGREGGPDPDAASVPPDVVLIVIDTARADHFGCYGYPQDTTPNIDAFARDSVLYRGVRSTAPWTLPSHASIFTGLRAGEHGLHWSPEEHPGPPPRLVTALREPARERLLAALLAERGYATFAVSNNRWVSRHTGLDAGFDPFFAIPPGREGLKTVQRWLGDEAVPETAAEISFALFRRRLDARAIERPFFAFFNLMEPHFPYLPAADQAGRFGGNPRALRQLLHRHPLLELAMLGGSVRPDPRLLTALYDGELATVDAAVGKFFDLLRKNGLYDDALIIVTSDHGEHLGEGARYSHQLSVADELLEVPLIIKYPRGENANTIVEQPLVSLLDLHQTILAAAWPENPLAGGRSQDLGRMETFERAWSLAEYYYSPDYLAQIQRAAPGFHAAPHRVVRRVIVTPEGARELEPTPSPDTFAELPAPVRSELTTYLARLEALGQGEGVPLTPEDLEALRVLGYVE